MNAFTDLFIRRPVLASVVSLLILLVGGMAAFRLQTRQFPQRVTTTITITTSYPGAAADVIEGFITTPIEQAVASAEGIDTLVSTSQQNVSTITLNLRLDANPDRAMADALSKVNQVRGLLPRDANDPVVVKQTGQGFALMYLSFNSNQMTSSQITDYLTRVVQPRLQTVDSVANAQILGVRAIMPSIQGQLPAGLNATIAYDATAFIRASIYEVAKTLVEAAAIVIVVIFLFLGNLRSTFIPIVTIPLSLIGVMIALLALGYSINLLTLLALVLGIGLVVDDAIVVVENIYRHIEEGMTPFEAALRGAHEIALPVVAMTITLAAVYAPIGFVSGVTGALFREFAFTLAGAVHVSGLFSLALSPLLCSVLLECHSGDIRVPHSLHPVFQGLRR